MPDSFEFTPEQLRSLSQRQLSELYYKLLDANPQSDTPLYALTDEVGRLADLAWARDFNAGASDYEAGVSELQRLSAAADSTIRQLNNAAEIMQRIAKVVGYIQQGVALAAKVAPLFALAAPRTPGYSTLPPSSGCPAGGVGSRAGSGYYGWTRDLPDYRDLLYGAVRKIGAKLPSAVDLRAKCSPVENQLSLNSCTANALVGALEFLELKAKKPSVDQSRLFLYYNERVIEGTAGQDTGARLRDGIKSLKKTGICTEDQWPYDVSQVYTRPAQSCYAAAVRHEIVTYHSIRSLEETRACLAEGFPVVFGFAVFAGFESDEVGRTGVLNYPAAEEAFKGGHAVMAVGYNDKSQRLVVRNSWGWDWGQHGYFTMPYAYAFGGGKQQALASDFWTIRKAG